jgi:hypothetical protein
LLERNPSYRRRNPNDNGTETETTTFLADPEELRKLREEVDMDVEQVIERLQQEGKQQQQQQETEKDEGQAAGEVAYSGSTTRSQRRRVQFSNNVAAEPATSTSTSLPKSLVPEDPGNDADDDGDASDVEDYDDKNDYKSDEEFIEAVEPEVDDETTMAQEERLPQDISAQAEMDLLQRENELSVDELRKLYANDDDNTTTTNNNNKMDNDDSSTKEVDSPMTTPEPSKAAKSEALATEPTEMNVENEDDDNGDDRGGNESDDKDDSEENDLSQTAKMAMVAALAGPVSGSEDDGGEEFQPSAMEAVDDETTMEAEERLGRDMSYQDEIQLLKQESELSVEELRAKYANNNNMMEKNNDSSEVEDQDQDENDSVEATHSVSTAQQLMTTNADEEAGEDYEPDEAEGIDDETTLEAEERLGKEMSHDEEMSLLKQESDIPIEQLRARYAAVENDDDDENENSDANDQPRLSKSSMTAELAGGVSGSEDDGGEEFEPNALEGGDDETTMEAEERLGRDMPYEDEIALLEREGEMSVEELRAMYAKMNGDQEADSSGVEMEVENEESTDASGKRKREGEDSGSPTKKSRQDDSAGGGSDGGLASLNALEASAERARQTLATRPYLLSNWVKLRKYQQVGLNWLVSLQSRRLNGILADGTCLIRFRIRSLIRLFVLTIDGLQRWD